MLCREIVCSEVYKNHSDALRVQDLERLNVKLDDT